MAKKKKMRRAATTHREKATKTVPASQNRRRWLLWGIGGTAAVLGAGSIHAYDVSKRTLHDLSVIGSGKPVVVQIHDPSCPVCRKLKTQVKAATKDRDDLAYRLADISTEKGRKFQTQYNAAKITLLFFDAKGRHHATTQGLLTAEELSQNLSAITDG